MEEAILFAQIQEISILKLEKVIVLVILLLEEYAALEAQVIALTAEILRQFATMAAQVIQIIPTSVASAEERAQATALTIVTTQGIFRQLDQQG